MALTARPTKKIDLSKIDDIQDQIFGKEGSDPQPATDVARTADFDASKSHPEVKQKENTPKIGVKKETGAISTKRAAPTKSAANARNHDVNAGKAENLSIADLLATEKSSGIRYTSRPYTIPRSLTIDLGRLKSMFRTRELQYTQTELMEKMLKESLELVSASNYHEFREKALSMIKSPEQCSTRSVTLTEDTFFTMGELKADLAQAHGRRFSNDELLTTLLAVAFAPLYEQGLL